MRRVVVALGLLAVALGGLWIVLQREQREERSARRETALLQFDERDVTAIGLTLAGTDYRFESRDDEWWMTEPIVDRAEGAVLAELMSLARRSRVLLTIADPESLDAYGLAPANLILRIEGAEVPALRMGHLAPDGSGAYGVVDGREGVLLVEVTAAGLLTHAEPEAFREQSVSGVARTSIESVGLSGRVDPPIELRRHEQGWWIESPNRVPASDAAVVRLLDAVDNAEVVRLIDGADRDDPTFGTGDGAIVVDLRTATGKHRSVRIGHLTNAGMTYVVREDRSPVFVVEGDVLAGLPRSIEDLGDVRLTKINRYQIRNFSYVRGTERFEAVRDRDSGAWSSSGASISDDVVYGFLVKSLEAPVRMWTTGPPPDGEPQAELLWTLADGTPGRALFWPGRIATVDGIDGLRATLKLSPPAPPAP